MLEQILWLTICLYHEARGEPTSGQVAVAHVILNRVEKSDKSVKDVVLKPWQFSWANRGKRPPIKNYRSLIKCYKSAIKCIDERMDGKDFYDADHYFGDYISPPEWSKKMRFVKKIGKHLFYKS